jgi:hypothetical protein
MKNGKQATALQFDVDPKCVRRWCNEKQIFLSIRTLHGNMASGLLLQNTCWIQYITALLHEWIQRLPGKYLWSPSTQRKRNSPVSKLHLPKHLTQTYTHYIMTLQPQDKPDHRVLCNSRRVPSHFFCLMASKKKILYKWWKNVIQLRSKTSYTLWLLRNVAHR